MHQLGDPNRAWTPYVDAPIEVSRERKDMDKRVLHGRVQDVVDYWIGTTSDEFGTLVQNADFKKLRDQIPMLATLSSDPTWLRGIVAWSQLILVAENVVRDQILWENKLAWLTAEEAQSQTLPPYGDCSFELQKDYARAFKYAVMQGAIRMGVAISVME
jgi:hypothetical protein